MARPWQVLMATQRSLLRRQLSSMPMLSDLQKSDAFVEGLPAEDFEKLVLSCGKRLTREHPINVEKLMAKADKNDDGVLDLCEFTSFWRRQGPRMLVRSAAAAGNPPTSIQLRRLAVISALPCVVFGFLDNSIMLVAGDTIDVSHRVSIRLILGTAGRARTEIRPLGPGLRRPGQHRSRRHRPAQWWHRRRDPPSVAPESPTHVPTASLRSSPDYARHCLDAGHIRRLRSRLRSPALSHIWKVHTSGRGQVAC